LYLHEYKIAKEMTQNSSILSSFLLALVICISCHLIQEVSIKSHWFKISRWGDRCPALETWSRDSF